MKIQNHADTTTVSPFIVRLPCLPGFAQLKRQQDSLKAFMIANLAKSQLFHIMVQTMKKLTKLLLLLCLSGRLRGHIEVQEYAGPRCNFQMRFLVSGNRLT